MHALCVRASRQGGGRSGQDCEEGCVEAVVAIGISVGPRGAHLGLTSASGSGAL